MKDTHAEGKCKAIPNVQENGTIKDRGTFVNINGGVSVAFQRLLIVQVGLPCALGAKREATAKVQKKKKFILKHWNWVLTPCRVIPARGYDCKIAKLQNSCGRQTIHFHFHFYLFFSCLALPCLANRDWRTPSYDCVLMTG